jgi:mannuronan synthase
MQKMRNDALPDAQAPDLGALDLPELSSGTSDHPLINIPFTAEIDGRQYKGSGLSLVRAEVFGLMDPAIEGAARLVRLAFVFQGFTVVIGVQARLNATPGPRGKVILEFTDPTGAHLPQLRHVLNSFVAGDLVTMGQFLSVAATQPSPKVARGAAGKVTIGQRLRALTGTAALLALTIGLFGAVGTLGYQRLFVTPLPSPARILPEGQSLTALAAGQIEYLNENAGKGEVAFSLRSVSGQMLSVAMPCDCDVLLAGPKFGDTVQAGEAVLLAHDIGAPLVLLARVPGTALYDLATADHVDVVLADGSHVTAHLAETATISQSARAEDEVVVSLVPDVALSVDQLGDFARVSIIQPLPTLLSPLADYARSFGG